MKYKVGDKVRVKPLEELKDCACVVPSMEKFAGMVMTITEVKPFKDGISYHIADSGSWYWNEDCFTDDVDFERTSPDMTMEQWAEETDGERRPLEDVLKEKVSELEYKVSILECRLSELEAKARAGEL